MDGSTVVDYARPSERPLEQTAPKAGRRRWSLKRLLIAGAALLFLAMAAVYGSYYWTTGRFLVSTDDAYVQAHSVLISPKVSGYISEVPVDDNQAVTAGQVLARIEPQDYRTALDQARANVAAARASIDTFNQQIAQQRLVVEQDRQQVVADQAALVYSQQDFQRYTQLAKDGWGPVQRRPAGAGRHSREGRRAAARHHGRRRRREADRRPPGAALPGRRHARPAAGDASTRPSSI